MKNEITNKKRIDNEKNGKEMKLQIKKNMK